MPIQKKVELTDSETAVLIDSLAYLRDQLQGIDAANRTYDDPLSAPNVVQSALRKITSLMTPGTFGLRIEAVESRWKVQGHWRNQSHGPRSSLRRPQWIDSFTNYRYGS
jgi:hypothetical protein